MADKTQVPEGNDKTKALYDNLPQEHKEKQSYQEWLTEMYHKQYDNWMPWIEDQYLKWFGKDNKASYAARDTLDKTKVTGIPQVDKLQDDTNNLVAGQFGKGGLVQPIGDLASKEGINRAERGGKDDQGNYVEGPAGTVANPVAQGASSAGGYLSGAGSKVTDGAKSAGGYLGGFVGGGKGEEQK
ncbi:MAG: hypothetical protein M1821_002397 [Bathelium mastoideum]|nr:MAG: hypothetical protein M1821_002397 [Bathelium mastoideum]KAI9686393.1 MAG: hypothetical protein M1822_003738 [Bathelium mastoideum]